MPYQQRSGSLLYLIHAQLCQKANGNSVPILSFWIAMLSHCTSVRERQSVMESLLQHFYDYKGWRLADRNIGLRDQYIDPNTANTLVALLLKGLFVIHTHVVSACCDLDRSARASGKSCSKSSIPICTDIPFSFLLIFLERWSVMSVHLQKGSQNRITQWSNNNKAEKNWVYCT